MGCLAFTIMWALLHNVYNGKGDITVATNRCQVISYRMVMCKTSMTNLKPCDDNLFGSNVRNATSAQRASQLTVCSPLSVSIHLVKTACWREAWTSLTKAWTNVKFPSRGASLAADWWPNSMEDLRGQVPNKIQQTSLPYWDGALVSKMTSLVMPMETV
jgi:hypothetical protein